MLKPILLLFAAILVALAPATLATARQAPEPVPAPSQAPAAPAAPAATAAPAPVAAPAVVYAKNPIKPTAESQTKAKNMYQIDCAVCHGDDGNGKTDLATSMTLTLDDWTDPKSLAGKQDGQLFKMIRDGKDKMPPEDPSRAKDDDVWNLVIYIRSFSKAHAAVTATAAQ
ncbi:MAG TPA: cytochrome c [Terracidiphilus sp.]